MDGEGHSLAGIWVTPFDAHGPVPFQPDLVTEADGSFSTDCGVKVLLTSWPVVRQQPSSARNLAVTWVGGGRTFAAASDVPCRSSRHRTIMPVGGILEGAFHVYRIDGTEVPFQDGGNPGGGLYCPGLWLNDLDAYTCSGWQIRHGRYRFVGLPTGTYRLNTEQTADRVVEVVAGRTTTRDWYDCEQCNFGRVPPSKTIAPSPSPVSPS